MPESVNPYIAGSPVTGSDMFFGREDVFAFIRHALTGKHRDNVIVLYGQRRTGKTSVLYQMSHHLSTRYLCVFIDMHGLALEGLGGFLWELATYIVRVLRREYQIDLPRLNRIEFAADPRATFEHDFLNQVWAAVGDRHLLLMLDEAIRLEEQIRAGRLEPEIFEYLRHLMQHHERLNFLFALGSGLEEMEKEYSFLFSVGLYKKISFLEEAAATALITQPVKDCYEVAPAALERIAQITSGHPYYTQLLCHSLFNRWQQRQTPTLEVADVEAVLDEVVERGLAVLKHVWEDSTPSEKAILAGIVAAMGAHNRPVSRADISHAWAKFDVTIPPGEVAKAIRSLIARDIIVGRDAYVFTVDLQRVWIQKYERPEWVKEAIHDALQEWAQQPRSPAKPLRRPWLLVVAVLSVVLVAVLLIVNLRQTPEGITTADSGGTDSQIISTEPPVIPGGEAAKVSDLIVASDNLWAATDGGLVNLSADGFQHVRGPSIGFDDECMNTIVAEPDGTLWIGCGGVAHIRPASDHVVTLGFYNRDDGLGMGVVRTLMLDTDGSIWAGGAPDENGPPPLSHYDGKDHSDGNAWRTDQPPMEALAQQQGINVEINSLLRSSDGSLWIGLHGDGVLRWDGQRWTHFGPEQGVSRPGDEDRRIRRLLEDDNGRIWAAASDQGLLRFTSDTGHWEQVDVGRDNVPIRSIAQFTDGSLWAGGDELVVRSLDGGRTWTEIGTASDGIGTDIGALAQDDDGWIWIGAYQGGISYFDGQQWHHLQR